MACLFTAKYLLRADSSVMEDVALLEDQGRIVEIGFRALLQKSNPTVSIIDYGDAVMLPTFINAHTHLELSLYPTWAEAAGVVSAPKSFVDWILQLIRVKRSINSDEMSAAISVGLQLCLDSGTAAVGDILSWYKGRSAFVKSPLCGRIYLESLGQDLYVTQQQFKNLCAVLNEERTGGFEFGVSPHSPYTIRPAYMAELFEHCRSKGLSCSTHIAESQAEVEFLQDAEGELVETLYPAVNWHQHVPNARKIRPVDYLAEHGGLFQEQLLVHGVRLTPAEITKIVDSGSRLVLCPRSNAHLQVGTAPVAQLRQAGVKLALGTDSLASNQSLSMWDELAFASEVYADALDPADLLVLATSGGAEALGLAGQLGDLSPGMRCSFQVVAGATALHSRGLVDALICEGQAQQISALVLDGTVVKQH